MTDTHRRSVLGLTSLLLGIAGLLPVLPLVGSVAAVACGAIALGRPDDDRSAAWGGIVLGVVGVVAPLVALAVYCWVLGYPMPIHRYRPS